MFDERGEQVKVAGPSVPVEVLGLDDVPLAGDELRVAPSDKVARTVAEARAHWRKTAAQRSTMMLSGGARLEDVFAMVQRGEVATLNLIVKSDTQGSLEAITDALRKLDAEHDEVRLSFVHRGVGGISESDINLAVVSNATVIGFNVRPDRNARELAEREDVELRLYEVIYNVLEDVNNALVGLLKPEFEEVVTGDAEVREVFSVPRVGRVAGCYVTSGVITRGSKVRFLRDGTIIWKGAISSLRRFKDDVREVRDGFECGIGLDNYQDLKAGDVIETYEDREDRPRVVHARRERGAIVMHAAAVCFELHVPESRSLKTKRAAIRPIVDGLRHRFKVSVAEVDHQDTWQRAAIGVALVDGSASHLQEMLDSVERFVAAAADVELLDIETTLVGAEA